MAFMTIKSIISKLRTGGRNSKKKYNGPADGRFDDLKAYIEENYIEKPAGAELYPELFAEGDEELKICELRTLRDAAPIVGSAPCIRSEMTEPFPECSESESKKEQAETVCERPVYRETVMQTQASSQGVFAAPQMAKPAASYNAKSKENVKSKFNKAPEAPLGSGKRLEDIQAVKVETFGEYLQRIINKKGMTNKQICYESNLTKQYLSKLLNNRMGSPAKEKLLCIAVALKLNLDETRDFLLHAGYAISPYNKIDLVFEYYIKNQNYDIYEISYALEDMGFEGGLWPELA